MRHLYLIAACFLWSCNANDELEISAEPFGYSVFMSADNPKIATVSLNFERATNSPSTLISRAESLGVKSQVYDIMCNQVKLEMRPDFKWLIPPQCSTVTWVIRFDDGQLMPVQPSQQRSLSMSTGWWVLSGPSSLLRLETALPETPIRIYVSNEEQIVKTLFGINAPPNFYVIGNAPQKSVSQEKNRLTYFGDDLQTVLSVIEPAKHLAAIDYFKSVIGSENSRDENDLSVVWFGAPRVRREASGAAGYDTILANYIIPEDAPRLEEQLLSLMLVYHEQFHQLDTASHPVWIGESLANYYALKALKKSFPNNEIANKIWKRFIDETRPIDIGLFEIQKQISDNQNRQNYGFLYTQGATFWSEIDAAIQEVSLNDKTLDDFMPDIMSLDATDTPEYFTKIEGFLSLIPKKKFETIKGKYLE